VVDLPPGSRVHNATNSAGMGSSNVNIDYDRMGRALVNALVTSGYIR
jgi:polysaccharide pyruvyl transferase WcaK-like protein